ncbi:putative lipid II flippase FtsW [Chlamydiifrater phoenicopteri]|uniref:putative lipid II flippase FtsW n=1 Tax=Chlamydiifrater phoenicopteri TaxID=2681469 RepID=UPI001BCE618C
MKWFIVSCLLGIFSLGLIMVFDTSSAEVLDRSLTYGTHKALIKQIVYVIIGLLVAAVIRLVGWKDVVRASPLILSVSVVFLILVLVPGVGVCRNGARRWLGVGHLTIQPSEFVKYLVPLACIERLSTQIVSSFSQFLRLASFLCAPILLIAIEPDNGSAAVIACSLIPIFFLSSLKIRYWLLPLLVMIVFGGAAAYRLPYVRNRIHVYLHPEVDLKGRGHQPHQAKIAAGSGRLFGKGLGGSLQKLTYLPEAQNDYIAAIFAEEFGFLGMLLLILLYLFFIYGGYYIAMMSRSEKGAHVAISITFLIAIQAFLNLAVVSGLLPSKGVNLPFFSQGGSSLIANICGVTVLLKVYEDENKKSYTSDRRNRGACYPSS